MNAQFVTLGLMAQALPHSVRASLTFPVYGRSYPPLPPVSFVEPLPLLGVMLAVQWWYER